MHENKSKIQNYQLLEKGDIIIGLEAVDDSWTRGRNLQGQVGIFPSAFCWRPDMNLLFKQKSAFGQVEKFAQVVHSMQALLEQEMNLVQGEIIKITEIVDKDWYRGEANGKSGIFQKDSLSDPYLSINGLKSTT